MAEEIGKTLTRLRRGVLGLLVAGLIGIGAELLLMGHTDGWTQVIPLLLIGLSLLNLGWYALGRSGLSLQVFRVIMLLSIVSGALGSLLHYRGNVEFEIERTPGLKGISLFRESITGATPALAPGTMALLGALGLLFTLGHPRLRPTSTQSEET
jgi:hypothetical protein